MRDESPYSCNNSFTHLHVHTEYSLLDGASRIKELVYRAKELGMQALAITDHGVMYGVIDFYLAAKEAGIKPIIGCEVYVAPRTRFDREPKIDDRLYHLVLLAENNEGYANLLKIVSLSSIEGFYYRPRVDKDLLRRYSKGIIALSSCIGGEIPQRLLAGDKDGARNLCLEYRDIFGAENFFLEIQDQDLEEERAVNPQICQLAGELSIPLVCTNDVHYTNKADAEIQDILLCVQTGKSVDDADRMSFQTREFYLKSPQEMASLFAHIPEALENTGRIAERCRVEIPLGGMHLPAYPIPAGHTADSYLEELCRENLSRRYPHGGEEVQQRLGYELEIIRNMGYSSYFLIVWDFIRFAREKGIMVGPGRGSAAGSIVAYLLGITNIDPLRYGLLFERFLNPERVSMPDIDIDFCFERREEVIDYVVNTYGEERVAQIITFGTMAARAAIRDVGRALNMPYGDVDKVAKMIPQELGMTIEKALQLNPDLVEAIKNNPMVEKLINIAKGLEGIPRHASTHAAGVVISKENLTNYLPLQKVNGGMVVTQFSWENVEKIGLLKMDFLGLRTLTMMEKTLKLIYKGRKVSLSLDEIPFDDRETYGLLGKADTLGVFQLESSGLRAILRELQPDRFEDIIALVALYRPGPLGSGMVEDFIRGKHGGEGAKSLHPMLEPILQETYGVILYQEQVMQIASTMAGFSLGQADLLRRAMGKKKPEVIAAQKENFLQGALQNGVDRETAGKIFDLMAHFAGYGFNKSHSAAYAVLAYQTAFLKAHYPVEYMAALLSSFLGNNDKIALYILESRQAGIDVLPPDINKSSAEFTVENGKIRFGLAAVKNVGEGVAKEIARIREEKGDYISFVDFCEKLDPHLLNKRALESLIKAGTFDCFGTNRATLLCGMEDVINKVTALQKERANGQLSLLDLYEDQMSSQISMPEQPEFPAERLLAMEKEVLGFYLTGHPLRQYEKMMQRMSCANSVQLQELAEDSAATYCGMIVGQRQVMTKKGETMAFLTVEDLVGSIDVVVFPSVYRRYKQLFASEQPIIFEGRVNHQDEEVKLIAQNARALQESPNLHLKVSDAQGMEIINRIIEVLMQYPGDSPVYLHLLSSGKTIRADRKFWVNPTGEIVESLEKLEGVKAFLQ